MDSKSHNELPAAYDLKAVQVRRAVPENARDAAAILTLLDSYASDPRGGGQPLPGDVRTRLIPGLIQHPTTRIWLAFDGAEPVGLCVGFIGFSTFQARALLNIHDLAVLPGRRGGGIGRALLAAAEQHAREADCCKLTLEVQDDNTPARHLYERYGFRDVVYGNSGPTRFLSKSLAG
jgi:ribosomal protein S18 acetylase RimI-like enzyme